MDFASFRIVFNRNLGDFLASKAANYKSMSDELLIVETLDQAVALANHGGKRVRPYLCWLAYATEGGTDVAVPMRGGLALELFHVFALIHDDIIDRGTMRHGLPTIHCMVTDRLSADLSAAGGRVSGDAAHIGEGMAMLAGDLLFGWSQEVITSLGNARVQQLFFDMIEQVVVGQMLDVAFMTKPTVTMAAITKKNEMKTARYSFLSPMLMGAALAGSEQRIEWYTKLGLSLGQAFQMQDDLLDVTGNAGSGKMPFIDVQDGQHTFLSQFVFDHGSDAEREALRSRFGKPLSEEDRAVLSKIFASSGAVSQAERDIETVFATARRTIESSDLAEDSKASWLALVAMLDKRSS